MKRLTTLLVFLWLVSMTAVFAVDPTLNNPVCNAPYASCQFPENRTIALQLTVSNAPSAPAENLQFRVADISASYGSNPLGTFSIGTNEATWSYSPGFDNAHLDRAVTVTFEIYNSTDPSIDQVVKTITAFDVNRLPIISDIPNQNVLVGVTRNIQAVITDGDDGNVPSAFTWSVNSVPFLPASELQISSTGRVTIKTNTTGTFTVTVTATDSRSGVDTEEFTLTVSQEDKIRIKDVTVVHGNDDDSVDNGDSFEADPGETLEFQVEVENLFTDDEDIDLEDVKITITIEDFDDGDDEKESSDRFDINADDSQEETVEFNSIPLDISDGDHTITVKVEGQNGDNNAIVYTDEIEFTMEINKEDEDFKFTDIGLSPAQVTCENQVTLSFTLENVGTDDTDEAYVTIENRDLGIAILAIQDETLDEGDNIDKSIVLNLPSSRKAGNYPINIQAFFDEDDYDDDDPIEEEILFLQIGACGTAPTPTPGVTPTPTPNVIVVTPTPTPAVPTPLLTSAPVTTYEEPINNSLLIAGLVVGIIIVVVLIIFLITRLVK